MTQFLRCVETMTYLPQRELKEEERRRGEERGWLRWGERGCCEGMKDDEEGSEGERE